MDLGITADQQDLLTLCALRASDAALDWSLLARGAQSPDGLAAPFRVQDLHLGLGAHGLGAVEEFERRHLALERLDDTRTELDRGALGRDRGAEQGAVELELNEKLLGDHVPPVPGLLAACDHAASVAAVTDRFRMISGVGGGR
ncbi:hypothetical protein ABTY96_42410 [Streptomyces sp. NPDC096057]|uniref:hypothetical protein n=1 Tax=Streptomyces sp. NPDC096057 TaxID=3155543 RepID=UPI003332A076